MTLELAEVRKAYSAFEFGLVDLTVGDRRVGIVFQDGALFPHMTARENIESAATTESRIGELILSAVPN